MAQKYLTLSFDDGTLHDKRFTELLNRYDLKCTFNINSGLFGNTHMLHQGELHVDHSELTAEEIVPLFRGHEIAAHTLTHPNLKNLPDVEITREINEDVKSLSAMCGYPVIGMAYPGGSGCYDERVVKVISETTPIVYARTTTDTHSFTAPKNFLEWHPTVHSKKKTELFELAEQFLTAKAEEEDLLFYVWGHSYEFEGFGTWSMIEDFFRLVSGKTDIRYVTNIEYYSEVHRAET